MKKKSELWHSCKRERREIIICDVNERNGRYYFKNASSFQKYFLSALQRKANVLKLIQKSSVFDGQLIRISVDARRY